MPIIKVIVTVKSLQVEEIVIVVTQMLSNR